MLRLLNRAFAIAGTLVLPILLASAPAAPAQQKASAEDAQRLLGQCTTHSQHGEMQEAVAACSEALPMFRALGDRAGEAATLNRLGYAYQNTKQTERALQSYQQALAIEGELGDHAAEAETLASLGFTCLMSDQYDQAIAWYEKALSKQRELKDRAAEATTLDRIAFAYQQARQIERAIQSYEQALAIERELKDRSSEAQTLEGFAFAYSAAMKLDKVVEQYEKALAIRRELKDRAGEARTLQSLGSAYWNVHQAERAIQAFEQALTIERELKDQKSEVETLDSFGLFYWGHDQYDKAIECYQRAVAIRHELRDRAAEAKTYDRLGVAYRHANQTEKAIEAYQQELAILRELKDPSGEADTFHEMGYAYETADQYDKAIPFYEEEVVARRDLPDRAAEARAHFWLGYAYRHERQFEKALQQHEQELVLRRGLKDREGEASALHNLSFVYSDEKDFDKEIACIEQELAIRREIKDRKGEADALRALGGAAQELSQYEKALGYYEQVLAIRRELKDRGQEGKILNAIGVMHAALGHYDKELDDYRQALAVARETGNRENQSLALFTLGTTYLRLGRQQEAIEYFEQALAMARAAKSRIAERGTLLALGALYAADPGQREKGLRYLDQSLALARAARDRTVEGRVLLLQGIAYVRMNQLEKAVVNLQASLAIARAQKDGSTEAFLLQSVGHICILLGRYDIATIALEQAMSAVRQVKVRELEAPILSEMMVNWASRNQPHLAIVLGKEAVNILQELRGSMRSLDPILQQSFVQKNEATYRYLANLLVAQGRLAEAQQVLDLQKQDEFSTFVQRDSKVLPSRGSATLTPKESDWAGRYLQIADRLTALGLRRGTLLAKTDRAPAEDAELARLEADLEVGNRAFQSFLDEMEAAFRASKGGSDEVAKVREAEGLMETLRDLGQGTVAVYTIFGEQGVRTILITPDVQKGYLYKIPAAELNKKILAFREAVRSPASDPRPLAKELYDILVKPMEQDLEGVKAQTIMWSLDGALRYVPVAALYDGQRFLVERYRNVIFTPASQSRLKDAASHDWRGLGLGVSLAHEGFQALPNVPSELHAIIRDGTSPRGIFPGTMKLDGDFTKEGLRTELRRHYSIVHLASHFDFVPGTDRNSFLLLGDGSKLTLEEFRNMPQVLQGVELLTLSACDTAVGGEDVDGKEVEGFAVLAQRQGAKAVVATLWAVADQSTGLLMQRFYQRLATPGVAKAEALQQAQLSLLRGTRSASGVEPAAPHAERGFSVASNQPPVATANAAAPYAHPYFWAPFILIGNGR